MATQIQSFGTVKASSIMTEHVQSVLPETPIPQAINQLLASSFSEMPIVDESGIYLGMFSERCCMRVLATLAELAPHPSSKVPTASDVMVPRQNLLVLSPQQDVHTAMELLLDRKCSDAPVVDSDHRFLGIFSEKTCMGFVCEAAYNRLPSSQVVNFIDADANRLIDAQTDLHAVAKVFMTVPYGRLPIMEGLEIAGQVSRRDVLQYTGVLESIMECDIADTTVELASSPRDEEEIWLLFRDTLSDHTAIDFRDDHSQTIDPDMNLFSIARLFLVSPFRRFPVLEEGELIGQISRCDLLREVLALTR